MQSWLREVMQRYERPLVSFAAHITGSRELGREVVQDTFERLCGARREEVEPRLAAWLFTVCRNRALDVARKEGRMGALTEREQAGGPSPATLAEARQEVSRVLEVLAGLPPSQQEVVRLRLQAGLSYREISEVTGHTVSNVGVLLHGALSAVRKQLGADGAADKRRA